MTIVGTRPEVIKLSRVIAALDRHTDHVLVHSGQNYDPQLNEVFFRAARDSPAPPLPRGGGAGRGRDDRRR